MPCCGSSPTTPSPDRSSSSITGNRCARLDRPSVPDAVRACVIGAGPAGDAVSRVLARAGIEHDVFDENERTGGNIDRIPMDAPPTALEARAAGGMTKMLPGTDVVDLTRDRVVRWLADGSIQERAYDAVFVCTGGYDGALPRRWARS